MIKSRIARFAGIAAGAAFALSFAGTAGAQTMSVAQLQAQINALMAQLQAMQGGTASVSFTFTRDLTVGSTGADVTALQQFLVSKGFLTMPAGTAYGYFGGLTRAAVARWQASNGVTPSVGYFGAKSRAAIAAMMGNSNSGNTTTGGTVSTGNTATGITTPGREGILSITSGPLSNTVANVGQTMVAALTIRAQAQNSDIDIQRVTLNLGSNTALYNKIYNKVYLVDAASGNVLASQNLNSSTVIQSGSDYLVTITGFHFVVPMNTTRDLQVKVDLYSSIDSAYLSGGASAVTTTITVPANGVRGIDGAGIDQFGPTSSFSQALTINRSLVDNAQANVSLAPSSPLTNSVPVTDTVNGQILQVPILTFNVNAQNDTLHLRQVRVNVTGTASGNSATTTTVYLYNGSTQIASASVVAGVATFSNITNGTAGASIPAGTTVPFTVKADASGVTAGSLTVAASLNTSGTTILNSQDGTVTISGSASGNTQTILGKGPAVSLVSSSINKTTTSSTNVSTSTLSATFNIQVQAVGADVMMGTQASTSPAFVFGVYQNGAAVSWSSLAVASTSSFALPTGVVDNGSNTFTIPQNTTVTIPVTVSFQGRTTAGAALSFGNYSIGLERVNYVVSGTASGLTFMSGQTAWRTTEQVLP